MKQIYILVFLGVLASSIAYSQAPRRVLVEEFTQASCPPCAVYNPGFHKIIFTPGNESKVTLLCYQTSWPGTDPMNSQNPTDVQSRVTYYGVNAVPDCLADGGVTQAGAPIFHGNIADFTQGIINTRSVVTSPVEITVNHELATKLDSVTMTVSVKNVSANVLPAEYTMHVILIEKVVEFHIPPGTNGELEFYSVTRKMAPNAAGTKLTAIDPGASLDYTFKIAIPSYIYNLRNLGVVAFVQHTAKKEVIQSNESFPKAIPGASTYVDLGTSATLSGFSGICDNNIAFKVDFENLGTDTIRTLSVDLMINNVKKTGQTNLAVNIPAGGTGFYEFKNVNITPGKAQINYRINNVNGASKDIDKLNNTGPHRFLYTVDPTPFTEELHEAFEVSARGVIPAHNYVENYSTMRVYPADKAFFGAPEEIGAFGNSVYSLFWDFYFGPENTEVGYFFDKVNLTNSKNTAFMMSRAFATKNSEAVSLIVEASKDCGANWTTIYSKVGDELATVAPIPGTFFAPSSADWIRDTTDISQFDGEAEVIFRLKGFNPPGGSNLLFLDDIDIAPLSPVGVEDAGILTRMEVFPNPVKDQINIQVNSQEKATASIQLYDVHGKMISVLDRSLNLFAGENQKSYNVSAIHSGVYNLKIVTDKGVRNHFIQIQ